MQQGPNFNGRCEIFAEVAFSLMQKAADSLSAQNKQESDQVVKKLEDRVKELE